ncbi:MAG: family 16 glycosylhydrolase, partial [Thermoguttaceae bacterium]
MRHVALRLALAAALALIADYSYTAPQAPSSGVPSSATTSEASDRVKTDEARAGANLVVNPGFEELKGSAAASWLAQNQAKWGESANIDQEITRSGARSVRLAAEPRYVTVASEPIAVEPCHVYYLSFWRKQEVEAGAEASSYLTILLNNGRKPLYWDGKSRESATSGWKKYVLKYITPDDVRSIQVGLNMDCRKASTSRVWFDDVEVLDGNRSLPAQPKPIPYDQCPLQHGSWTLAPELSDEFNATAIDAAKWEQVDRREWGRAFAMMAKNASQKDGALQISITPGELPGKPNVIYHSAMLKTRELLRYGYLEIRAKLSACPTRNAFWLYHQSTGGNGWSEIDIFEAWGGTKARGGNCIPATLHLQQLTDPAQWTIPTRRWDAPVRLDQDFHVYALEWNDTHLVVYFDHSPVIVFENDYFHEPLNITLNAEPDGPRPDFKELPDTFVIDYLR